MNEYNLDRDDLEKIISKLNLSGAGKMKKGIYVPAKALLTPEILEFIAKNEIFYNPPEEMPGKKYYNKVMEISLEVLDMTISKIDKGWKHNVENDEKIELEDSNFTEVIKHKSNKPDDNLYQSDALEIKELHASNKNIESIEGIEQFTNLELLNLENNKIEDLTPLKDLNNLKVLTLENNNIDDITPLRNLTKLIGLGLGDNNIKEIGFFSRTVGEN